MLFQKSEVLENLSKTGIDMTPENRLSDANAVNTVTHFVTQFVGNDATCVVSACLGGAQDVSQIGILDSHAITAQAQCSTEITFDDAVKRVAEKDPQFADWLRQKAKAATDKTRIQDEATAKEAQAKVVAQIGETVSNVGGAALDSASFLSKHIVAVGVLALLVFATVVVVTTSRQNNT